MQTPERSFGLSYGRAVGHCNRWLEEPCFCGTQAVWQLYRTQRCTPTDLAAYGRVCARKVPPRRGGFSWLFGLVDQRIEVTQLLQLGACYRHHPRGRSRSVLMRDPFAIAVASASTIHIQIKPKTAAKIIQLLIGSPFALAECEMHDNNTARNAQFRAAHASLCRL